MKRERLVLLALIGGFLMMGIEVRYLHRNVVGEHWQGWIPIAYSGLAIVACLVALGSAAARGFASFVFVLGVGVGLYGFWMHNEGQFGKLVSRMTLAPPAPPEAVQAEGHEHQAGDVMAASNPGKGEHPAAIAPLGISGLALVGAIIAWPGKKA